MAENPLVEAKKKLIAAMNSETENLKSSYDKLKAADEVKVKRYFAQRLQVFCHIVDQSKPVVETYFTHETVPVSLIRALEDYYATMKVMLSEFPDVAMDPKLETAVSRVFLPYQQILSKLSSVADDFVMQQRAKKR